jgi:formate dehydrogenase (coenzyme F420) beta subunit
MIEAMRAEARRILSEQRVALVIGYELGTHGASRPAFVYDAAEVDRLVWNSGCHHTLAGYIGAKHVSQKRGEPPARLGMTVKACDVRAINVLIRDHQVPREDLYLIGVACHGMLDEHGEPELRCRTCSERTPAGCDIVIGTSEPVSVVPSPLAVELAHLEALTPRERQLFWDEEFGRCIRCYACRQACPGCYCTECTAEQLDPQWVGIGIRLQEKRFFHLMRAYHLAGRCVGCDECSRACPVGVRLDLLNAWMRRQVEADFGYRAGEEAVTPAPLVTFRTDESLSL